MENSEIIDCTYSILTLKNSQNVRFIKSKFSKNKEFDLINVKENSNVVFENCDISGNESIINPKMSHCLFCVDRKSSVLLNNSRILRNRSFYFAEYDGTVSLQSTLVENNEFNETYKYQLLDKKGAQQTN
jgi:hypothetical protein